MYVTHGMLTRDIADPGTSIGGYLRSQFPDSRTLQVEYKTQVGGILVDKSTASAGNIGTAVDLIVRLILEPHVAPESALMLFPFNPDYLDVVRELSELVGTSGSIDKQARAAWALALCVTAFRVGPAYVPEIVEPVLKGTFTVDRMIQEAPIDAVRELSMLRMLAVDRLIPALSRPYHLGPTFDLSKPGKTQRIGAEADLIADGLLLDIKTQLGMKSTAGARYDTLKPAYLYQLLGYVLLDYSNAYEIDSVGIYSARYGALVRWPLDYVMSAMSGRTIDITAARQELWDIMQS